MGLRADMLPSTTSQWTVEGKSGSDSLKLNEKASISELGDTECLVHFHYASLNYRDLIITKVIALGTTMLVQATYSISFYGKYLFGSKIGVVPVSDGAGTVEAVRSRVTRFKPGDKVLTLINQGHLSGAPTPSIVENGGVGGKVDGVLRQYEASNEQGLVAMPSSLDFKQASTLPVAALTAWNSLYGLESRALKPGDTVLTQGTGGVSLFALQFAKAAGARVIATTSSDSKAEILRNLGADHAINYKEYPNWGETARSLTPDNLGVHHILEIGGPNTLSQSFKAIKMDGVINIIGFMGGYSKNQSSFVECLSHICTTRGVLAGSRQQFEEMNAAIDASGIKPVVDEKIFAFEDVREAYQYMWEQKHLGKVTIQVDSLPESHPFSDSGVVRSETLWRNTSNGHDPSDPVAGC